MVRGTIARIETPFYPPVTQAQATAALPAVVAQLLAANATANTATCEYRFTPLHIAV